MLTFILISLLLGVFLFLLTVWVFFIRMGLRWAKIQDVTTRRIVCTIVVLQFADYFAHLFFKALILLKDQSWFQSLLHQPGSQFVLAVFGVLVIVLLQVRVLAFAFKVSWIRGLKVWLSQLGAIPIALLLGIFFRLFLFEAFIISGNSMAPTLLGSHLVGVCAECGGPSYCSPGFNWDPSRPTEMICRDNFHVASSTDYSDQSSIGDRVLAFKFLKPKRWDLVVFSAPPHFQSEEQGTPVVWVMRIVGLPGEEIAIKGGQVWTNGQLLIAPDSLRGLEYESNLPGLYGRFPPGWGSPDRPAKLADDEYYVLGDFSRRSFDSRFWPEDTNRPGRFAVAESDIKAVVTHVYWPLSRWRAFK
jgi:signal peptidase I